MNPTTPLPTLSSPYEGEERVAEGRERSGRAGGFMGSFDDSQIAQRDHERAAGFSLVEVMIALAIFFMAVFTILGLLSTVLSNARALQNRKPADAGMVAAYLLSVTNQLEETLQSGTFEDFGDFGGKYSNYEWTFDAREIETNGLWRVDCIVQRRPGGQVESQLSFFVFSPQSHGSLSGRTGGGLRP